jgi:hypothetical protein
MTLRVNIAKRKARNGQGLLPPNPNQWEIEHNGLDLREALGLPLNIALPHESVFRLVPDVRVLPHGALPLAQVYIDHFRMQGSRSWSGMAIDLNGAGVLVLYNDSHPRSRTRATLMEEFFHLWLEHPRTVLRFYGGDARRTHDRGIESEAYGSGAAALVPYQSLREHVRAGDSVRKIATFFEVSDDLVIYRMKVTKLYSSMR